MIVQHCFVQSHQKLRVGSKTSFRPQPPAFTSPPPPRPVPLTLPPSHLSSWDACRSSPGAPLHANNQCPGGCPAKCPGDALARSFVMPWSCPHICLNPHAPNVTLRGGKPVVKGTLDLTYRLGDLVLAHCSWQC